jgi:hypothetical protein
LCVSAFTEQRRAISTVFSMASGRSANSSRISEGDLQVLLRAHLLAVRLAQIFAIGDTHHGVVRLCVASLHEARVVRRDQRQLQLIGQLDQAFFNGAFVRRAVARDLDIAPARIGARQRGQLRPRICRPGLSGGVSPHRPRRRRSARSGLRSAPSPARERVSARRPPRPDRRATTGTSGGGSRSRSERRATGATARPLARLPRRRNSTP